MRLLKYSILVLFICSVNVSLNAQEQTESINKGTIKDQFEFTIRKSTDWSDGQGQTYEVIKRHLMYALKKHTLDSLKAVQIKLGNLNSHIVTQQKEIDTLKSELAKTQEILSTTNKEKESMVLLGMQMTKTSYGSLMWSTIAILTLFLLIYIYMFRNSNKVTKATKIRLSEVEEEYNEHRRATLEREQEIKRQLQNEINKVSH